MKLLLFDRDRYKDGRIFCIIVQNSHFSFRKIISKIFSFQIKSTVIENGLRRPSPTKPTTAIGLIHSPQPLDDIHIEFEPLVQVDPSVLTTNRAAPMKNPRPGDYLLSKTASTEGIASKKSLELKKRYLLGGDAAASGALMKSDSTSVLDSKFRNFHSNISECQKLLNATTSTGTTKVPQQPSPLAKSETTIGVPAIVSTNNTIIKLSSKEFDSMKNSDEKENVYGKFVKNKNKLNATTVSEHNEVANDSELPPAQIILDLTVISDKIVTPNDKDNKIIDQAAVESQLSKSTEVIDLVTPPVIQPLPTPIIIESSDTKRMSTANSRQIPPNKELYRRLDFDDDLQLADQSAAVIDLTADSPIKRTDSTEAQKAADHSKTTIDSMLKRVSGLTEIRKTKSLDEETVQPPRSPVHDTCIQVPTIPWKTKSKAATDVESDSLSSSTTSSVDDIPHYILDSTTSPDTLPAGSDRFIPPRLEIRDTSGELMQIDSLMIIDGKYVGDPEDLKIMQMPLVDTNAPTTEPSYIPTVREPKVTFDTSTTICDTTTSTATTTTITSSTTMASSSVSPIPKPVYKYETNSNKRPELRFDTRNANKIDTLKNIPLILPKRSASSSSSDVPAGITNLLQKSATVIAVVKPTVLPLNKDLSPTLDVIDMDKTPTAATMSELTVSDSETEVTGQVLTETELSDWNADDAVSENFVDIEFVLNSNKGTIRRNKKSRKKQQQHALAKQQIAKTEAPLAKDLDFDGIEFMDTGSEDSCLETYSATNKALLRNRGYVKFVDTTAPNSKSLLSYKSDAGYGSSPKDSSERSPPKPTSLDLHEAVNAEVSGVDYIEQGACILMGNGINDLDMITPMNEVPPIFTVRQAYTIDSLPPDSLNDMEEDSLLMIASQGTTTTEDSDALTIVTSPVDSTSPPKVSSNVAGDTPSSDKNTISSGGGGVDMPNVGSSGTLTTTTTTTATSTGAGTETEMESSSDMAPVTTHKPPTLSSIGDRTTVMQTQSVNRSGNNQPTGDECTYSDYVRKLQMKITKISNARDSIDVRKTKRKHSKGDLSSCGSGGGSSGILHPLSGVDCTEQPQQEQLTTVTSSVIDSNKPLSIYVNNDMPATLTERIEEITKERTKQKDVIHDLVMDKLQSKKQLNSEKRLNRSRNRSMAMFGTPPANAISGGATPLAEGFTMKSPHYYGTPTAVSPNYFTPKANLRNAETPASATSVTATSTIKYKDLRPLSDLINRGVPHSEPPKIMKTQSFCVYSATPNSGRSGNKSDLIPKYGQNVNGYATPVPPPRRNYNGDEPPLTQTERLRSEARERARLKSNKDLGLSPDEKMLLLRKRFHLDAATTPSPIADNKSDDMKVRERKMMSSKSVNDIAATSSVHDSVDRSKKRSNYSDFTSDPNLADTNDDDGGATQKRRPKDPERRRSIIKAVSDFFYKKKDPSPAKEKSPSSSNEGMFGRFRISPKSKSKVSGKCISYFISLQYRDIMIILFLC